MAHRFRYARRLLQSFAALALGLTLAPASAQAQSTPDLKALLDDLVAANHILYRQGVVDGFGHVSVRHPASPIGSCCPPRRRRAA